MYAKLFNKNYYLYGDSVNTNVIRKMKNNFHLEQKSLCETKSPTFLFAY